MKFILLALCLTALPTIAEASILGALFGTDHPAVEMHRMSLRHDARMARYGYRHERALARHDRSMARRNYSVSSGQRYAVRYYSGPATVHYYSVPAPQQRGTVIFHYQR